MTVLVGVRCKNGIVLGADGIATSANGHMPTIRLHYPAKMIEVGSRVLVATTGSVGLAQRFNSIVKKAYDDKSFQKSGNECSKALARSTCQDFDQSGTPRTVSNGYGFAALVAAEFSDDIHLVEFGVTDFQPEFKKPPLHFVSMGSGQSLADPFLAFVNRVLWKNAPPDVSQGLLGVYWVLQHTCEFAHAGVGEPITVGVIRKDAGRWSAALLEQDELGQLAQHVGAIESRISEDPHQVFVDAPSSDPPVAPGT